MKLIIDEASGGRQIALDFLCEEDDPNLLTSEAVTMTKDEYENLTEWYG